MEIVDPILLDCTLRDGSYAVNFQFTKRDTIRICKALDEAGLKMIEIGHGLGLGASSAQYGIAFETDETYLEAAAHTLNNAKWGAFFIPGIGSADDLRKARTFGMDFVRIGSEVADFESMLPFIEYAKELQLYVCANFMKSYAEDSARIAEVSNIVAKAGADCVFIVDSAGCMVPREVTEYVVQISERCDVAVGFHGHNNLGLANANCLAALEAGAVIVDGTIRGMGRSAGNAQTEVLSHLLPNAGFQIGIDPFRLFESGERIVRPLNVQPQGLPPLDIVIGMAKFHTSHLPRFRRAASEHGIDIKRLILEVSSVDCVNPSDDLIDQKARDVARTEGVSQEFEQP